MVGIVTAPLALLLEGADGLPGVSLAAGQEVWGWMLAAILIATCARFFLQTWGQSKTSASSAAVILIAEPVWSAMLAAAWFGESMSSMQMIGCGLIFSALLASRWPAVRQFLKLWF
jgi:drug/metabolite transporter (DMT)-like permease